MFNSSFGQQLHLETSAMNNWQGCTAEGGERLESLCTALLSVDCFKAELMAQELAGNAQEIQLSQHVQLHLVLQICPSLLLQEVLGETMGSMRREQ